MAVVVFYFIAFFVSLVVLVTNLFRNRKGDNIILLAELCVTLNVFGRYLVCVSKGMELALFAIKIHYIGGIFGMFLLTLLVAKICNIIYPKWVIHLMTMISFIIFACVLTIGHNTMYYSSVVLQRVNGYSYLEKTYGPTHVLFIGILVVHMGVLIGISVYAFLKKREVPVKTTATFVSLGIAIALSYILSRTFDTVIQWETLFTVITIAVAGVLADRLEMFNVSASIVSNLESMNEYGYIVFNKKFQYVSSNAFAEKVFLEIKKWKKETVIPKEASLAYREIVQELPYWINEPKPKILQMGEKYVELSIRDVVFNRKKVGYLVVIMDKTYEQRYLQTMKNYNAILENEVEKKTADILKIKDNMVLGMAIMVEGRDNSTGGHVQRTSDVVEIFANKLKEDVGYKQYSKEFFDDLIKAAPMHDLGKITVDDRVLRKQGKFTDEEYSEMKKHSAEGAKIVKRILKENNDEEFERIATNVAHFHHEKWNGTGYPNGLKGEEIPIEARIMAFADVYDALVSERCYKVAFSHEKAIEIIQNDLGSHFDPELGRVFLQCREELEALYESTADNK